MKVYKINDYIPLKNSVATTGTFDGVHLGHRWLLQNLLKKAGECNQEAIVVTFDPHPRMVLHPEKTFGILTTLEEKLSVLEQTGIQNVLVIDFDIAFSQLSANEFLHNIIKEKLNCTKYLIGYDHRFGHKRSESYEHYQAYAAQIGIELFQEEIFMEAETTISSSLIREFIKTGKIEQANNLLGYSYIFKGTVVGGNRIGRSIGFPTANIEPLQPQKIIPAQGVYAVWVNLDDKIWPGMLNIGFRPTLEIATPHLVTEVHIIGYDGVLYDRSIELNFVAFVRNEQRFENLEALTVQLLKDKEAVTKILMV